jgi:hypothetical protein
MKQVTLSLLVVVIVTLVLLPNLYAQETLTDQPGKKVNSRNIDAPDTQFVITIIIAMLIGILGSGGILAIIQHLKRKKIARELAIAQKEIEEQLDTEKNNRRSLSLKE